jgi:hypothetical protein
MYFPLLSPWLAKPPEGELLDLPEPCLVGVFRSVVLGRRREALGEGPAVWRMGLEHSPALVCSHVDLFLMVPAAESVTGLSGDFFPEAGAPGGMEMPEAAWGGKASAETTPSKHKGETLNPTAHSSSNGSMNKLNHHVSSGLVSMEDGGAWGEGLEADGDEPTLLGIFDDEGETANASDATPRQSMDPPDESQRPVVQKTSGKKPRSRSSQYRGESRALSRLGFSTPVHSRSCQLYR